MRLLKPTWVHHDEKPIFSVDVHQECEKFATGGQGMDSGRVVIWNLLPVISEKAELDESIPKMLCQMDNHLACVNCVRWSQNGQMLASGSDDKLVIIWRQSKGPSGVFGTGGMQKNAETWKCVATLRGHSGDVLDLAWSPQDRWLASCSIDNTIIIWDAQAFPSMVAMLKGHTGLVKGVTWDPVGKYLASQSDDRTVKIWKTSDWTCKSTIHEPFDECGGTTHILRLAWSSDGQYVVSAHAMNGGGPTAQIIERDDWKCDKDFVGHRKAVTCVRFHSSVLKRQTSNSNKPKQHCCLAIGSRDRSLSVWVTALQRPLVVIHELFNDSILDLSWGQQERVLLACSGDGTVACLQFNEIELGVPLSLEERNGLFQRMYGKATLENGEDGSADLLIENPELLNSSHEKIKVPSLPVGDEHNLGTSIHPATVEVAQTINGTSIAPGVGPVSRMPAQSVNFPSVCGMPINQQVETRTADGKRRITPMFIPMNQTVSTTLPVLSSSSLPSEPTPAPAVIACEAKVSESKENDVVISEAEQTRLDSRLIKSAQPNPKVEPLRTSKDTVKAFPYSSPTGALGIGVQHQATTSGPKIAITPSTTIEFQKVALEYRVHVHNGKMQTPSGLLAKISAYRVATSEMMWDLFVASPIMNLNFCKDYIMLCCQDGSLRFLEMQTGCPIFPIITLTTASVQCAFSPNCEYVGVVSECGIVRIWCIANQCTALATSCGEFLNKNGTVLQFHITDKAIPILLLSSGNSYTFSQALQSWIVLNNGDTISRHGLQSTMPKQFKSNYHMYPLASVQAVTANFSTVNSGLDVNASAWQANARISFIENQIKICESINSSIELKHWYSILAYQLALHGTEKRIRLLLNSLLGLTARDSSQSILSISKHTLLEEVLQVLKSHVKWQRIYMEYKELFDHKASKAVPAAHEDDRMDAQSENVNAMECN